MTKRKYLKRLRKALGDVPAREKEELVAYYNELIEESLDRGKTEREIFSELSTPEKAAENYLRERDGGESRESGEAVDRSEKSENSVMGTVFLPIRIVVGIALVIFGIALFFVLAGLAIGGVAVGIAGIYTFAISFGPLVHGYVGLAIAQFGIGIGLFAIGGLMITIVPLLWRLNRLIWQFVTWKRREGKPLRPRTLRSLGVNVALLVLGGIVFTAAFGALGFQSDRLAVTDGITEREHTLSSEEMAGLTDLKFEAKNLSLTIVRGEGSTFTLRYHEAEEAPQEFSYSEGVMTLTTALWEDAGGVRTQWRRGVLFSLVYRDLYRAELVLPAEFEGDLGIEIKNGTVSIADMGCKNLNLTTHNGAISMKNVTAQNITLETHNGAVAVENCTFDSFKAVSHNGAMSFTDVAASRAEIRTSNGAIRFKRLKSAQIELETSNGAIIGSISGRYEDYAVSAETHNGTCNLVNKSDGEKSLKARAGNGAIKIEFTN